MSGHTILTRRLAAGGAVLLLGLLSTVTALADEETDTLPGGTGITVAIDSPADGDLIAAPGGVVPVSGTASVGEGTPVKDTTLVFVMDRSGSMTLSAGVDCDGVAGNDSRATCQQEGVAIANQAAADAQSAVGLVGLASFASGGQAHDVDLGATGTQLLVAPDHDGDNDGTPDLEQVARSLAIGGQTDYAAGLTAASTIINDPANTSAFNSMIFMSDGENNDGAHVNTVAAPPATNIQAFALGAGVSCTTDFGRGSLNDVAARSTLGTGDCRQVTDLSTLADEIEESRGASLDSLTMTVNAGAAVTLTNAEITPDLPADGPVTASYTTSTSALSDGEHTICVTAHGTDAGGASSVTDCHIVTVDNTAPVVDCTPTTTPDGRQKPKAGDNSPGQNEDGFYELTADDANDADPEIYLVDTGSGTVFGPFTDGTKIKYVEDADATPTQKKMGGPNSEVQWHITGTGDAAVYAVDDLGNQSDPVDCLVPGPSK